jgi:hypothetical protein
VAGQWFSPRLGCTSTHAISAYPARGEVYLMQFYVIFFVNNLPPICNWEIVEQGLEKPIKHNHFKKSTYTIFVCEMCFSNFIKYIAKMDLIVCPVMFNDKSKMDLFKKASLV